VIVKTQLIIYLLSPTSCFYVYTHNGDVLPQKSFYVQAWW